MKTLCRFLPLGLLLVLGLPLLPGCGRKETASAATKPVAPKARVPSAQAKAFYDAHPKFYLFKTPADLPKDLKWEDGSELPTFGDPAAKRGGTQYSAIESWPPTIRTMGPDSNSAFRSFILDDNEPSFLYRHPNADGWCPGLCEAWYEAPDKQTVYLRIDRDARWSDGVPVTTDDIFFMYFMLQSPWLQDPFLNNFYTTEFESITKFDDKTFALKMVAPRPNALEYAAYQQWAQPEHFYTDMGNDWPQRFQWKVPPTTGPYTILPDGIEEGRAITQTRVADWWGNNKRFYAHRYNPDKIVYTLVRDRDKAFEMFKLGELDTFNLLSPPRFWYDQMKIPEVDKGYIEKNVFFTFQQRPPSGLWLNSKKPLLDNRDIRQGIAFACNWDKVIQISQRGDARRLHPWADTHPPFEDPTLRARPYDIDKALAAFARAGFIKRGPDGILMDNSGRRLSVTLTFSSDAIVDVPPILREDAAKAGLEIVIEKLDVTADYQKSMQKNHEIEYTGWSGGTEFAPRFWDYFAGENAGKPQTNNLSNTDIPELNQLIDTYRKSQDKDEMIKLSRRMIAILYEDAGYIPGYVQPFIRWGNWRWVRYPSWLNVREAQYAGQFGVHWIDEDMKKETLQARRDGRAFPKVERVDTKWKTD